MKNSPDNSKPNSNLDEKNEKPNKPQTGSLISDAAEARRIENVKKNARAKIEEHFGDNKEEPTKPKISDLLSDDSVDTKEMQDVSESTREVIEQFLEEEKDPKSEIAWTLEELASKKDSPSRINLTQKITSQKEKAIPDLVQALMKAMEKRNCVLIKEIIGILQYHSRHVNAAEHCVGTNGKKPDTQWLVKSLKGSAVDCLKNGLNILTDAIRFLDAETKRAKAEEDGIKAMELATLQKTILEDIMPAIGEEAVNHLLPLLQVRDENQRDLIKNTLTILEKQVRKTWNNDKSDTRRIRLLERLSPFKG